METKRSPKKTRNSPLKIKFFRQFPSERIFCYYLPMTLLIKIIYVAHVNAHACRVVQKGRIDKGSMKHRPSTMQGGEDYMVNKLYLADQEMDKLFNEDR